VVIGGYRDGSGRKKKPDSMKYHVKSFCLDKHILDWLNEKYPKKSAQTLVRRLLRTQYDLEAHGE
jgi:hypothetical protein